MAPDMRDGRPDLPAGDFSSWLRRARKGLVTECGIEVACGECAACCSSSYFIHVRPEETQTIRRIGKRILVAAPGLPKGNLVLGYDENGLCPMLESGRCSIFEHRPITCRTYDCRVYAAAGIPESADGRSRIDQRARRWRFGHPTERDLSEHRAVQAAARFIREHAECFPGGRIPGAASQVAILALKAYEVFLHEAKPPRMRGRASPDVETARAVVEACRKFDEKRCRRRNRLACRPPESGC